MEARTLAAIIITPFALAFVYAGIREYLRYRSEGTATYGLVYDEETGTTHVTGLSDAGEGFDPSDYNPENYSDPDVVGSDDAPVGDDEDEPQEKLQADVRK